MKRTPLNPKRSTPRRNEGRVQHKRVKRSYTPEPGSEELRYWHWLRARCDGFPPCEGCGKRPGKHIHHIMANAPGKRWRRDHWFVVLICPWCHSATASRYSVHGLGSEARFLEEHGVDLVAVSVLRLKEFRNAG